MKLRSSGILLHLSSLPSSFGIGDMGPAAYGFVDFLADAEQSYWQILPLNPTETRRFNSPYHSTSAFAFNPLLISPDILFQDGLLKKADINTVPKFIKDRVDYIRVTEYKTELFLKAYNYFKKTGTHQDFDLFCSRNGYWLDDFSLFTALMKIYAVGCWNQWPDKILKLDPIALKKAYMDLYDEIDFVRFLQYIFYKQWMSLKSYCHEKGVHIIGDLPIYVQHNSVDVWTHAQSFKLDDKKNPSAVAGVPPDYFSETGQLWGNPIYRWDQMATDGYAWWIARIAHNLKLFDFLRIDHFRGLISYWEVPATHKDAVNGKWVSGPAEAFIRLVLKKFPNSPFIAEDLGFITPDVRELLHQFDLPGMRVLLFGFGENQAESPHAFHNIIRNCVVYTGTHDNNTVRGWFENEAENETRKRLFKYLGRKINKEKISFEMVRLAMMSSANTAILPIQDVLGLGSEARMNRPAVREGNWQWRLLPDQLTREVKDKLLEITKVCGRA